MGLFSKKTKESAAVKPKSDTHYSANNEYIITENGSVRKVPLDELIETAKAHFKKNGFKKIAKRWIKETDQFKLVFYIQGSSYRSVSGAGSWYYVRPYIIIKALEDRNASSYGHFMKDIGIISIEQILADTEKFFTEWTNTAYIVAEMKEYQHCSEVGKRRSKFYEKHHRTSFMVKAEKVIQVFA